MRSIITMHNEMRQRHKDPVYLASLKENCRMNPTTYHEECLFLEINRYLGAAFHRSPSASTRALAQALCYEKLHVQQRFSAGSFPKI